MSTRCRKAEPRVGGMILAILLALPVAAEVPAAEPLRVCADPNNLPFSDRAGGGFENALAERVAEWLGRSGVTYTWQPQRRGFVRTTLDAGRCDAIMGVPAGYELARPTRPYYRSTYVFVGRRDAGFEVSSMDDPVLRRLRVGVPVVGDDYASTPGAAALGRRGIIDNVVGFSVYGDYSKPHPPSRLIEAVADGGIDVAIAWGPLAGYFANRQKVPLDLSPVQADPRADDMPFTFDISMATRPSDHALHAELDQVIATHHDEINELLTSYGVPLLPLDESKPRSRDET